MKELSENDMIMRDIDSSRLKNNLVIKNSVETSDEIALTKMSESVEYPKKSYFNTL